MYTERDNALAMEAGILMRDKQREIGTVNKLKDRQKNASQLDMPITIRTDRQTDRKRDRQRDRHAKRQTNRETDR